MQNTSVFVRSYVAFVERKVVLNSVGAVLSRAPLESGATFFHFRRFKVRESRTQYEKNGVFRALYTINRSYRHHDVSYNMIFYGHGFITDLDA